MAKKAKRDPSGPRVYSYVRFSTPDQIEGDSLRRQISASEEWCRSKGLVLDSELRISDLGVSGFRGKNADVGALSHFLKAVEAGKVAKGSYLLVENLDRLGRDEVKLALARFLELLNAGIVVVTLDPAREFGKESADMDLMLAIVEMARAHGESLRKSKLRGARWKADRERMRSEGVALTRNAPEWVEKVGERYKLIPERAKVIRRIFKLRREGLGPTRICKALNASEVWKPKSRRRSSSADRCGWRESYVKKILSSRAAIGEFQPHVILYDETTRRRRRVPDGEPIVGFFPAVVDEGTFLAVQSKVKNKANVGRTGKATNILRRLATCGYCGGPMHLVDKGPPPKGGVYLQCDVGRRGLGCGATTISYAAVQDAVLMNCRRIEPSSVLPSEDDKASAAGELRSDLSDLEARKQGYEEQIDNLTDQISRTKSPTVRDRLERKMGSIDDELTGIENAIIDVTKALRDAERTNREVEVWQSEIAKLMSAIGRDDAVDVRLKLNECLRGFLSAVECFPVGYPDGEEDDIGQYVDAVLDATDADDELRAEAEGLIEYLAAKRATRAGSFVRLKFPSGYFLPLAIGPLASGYVAETVAGKTESCRRSPDLDASLTAYRAARKLSRTSGKNR